MSHGLVGKAPEYCGGGTIGDRRWRVWRTCPENKFALFHKPSIWTEARASFSFILLISPVIWVPLTGLSYKDRAFGPHLCNSLWLLLHNTSILIISLQLPYPSPTLSSQWACHSPSNSGPCAFILACSYVWCLVTEFQIFSLSLCYFFQKSISPTLPKRISQAFWIHKNG